MWAVFTSKWFAALALIVLGLFLVLGIMRRSGCGERQRREREPRTVTHGPWKVTEALSGVTLICRHGRERRPRSTEVTLKGIACWPVGHNSEEARTLLRQLAGETVTVETERRGILRDDEGDDLPEDQLAAGYVAGDEVSGVVRNAGGQVLQVEMLAAGACWIDPDVLAVDPKAIPASWKAAEAEAKKQKRGIWSEEK